MLYFYIDESGHTGSNLFDPEQPILYYGVLSSRLNIDFLAQSQLQHLRHKAGVPRLHAAELGNGGLNLIAGGLIGLQRQFDLRFDLYKVNKVDHAIICFFDQIFDQGVNPAITWTGYWTPLRYVLLLKVAYLFDRSLAEAAWKARIELNSLKAEAIMTSVCNKLRSRVNNLPDKRSRQLVYDSLTWAINNPSEIYYNVKTKKDRLQVMPNIIGFQSVMLGIAKRIKASRQNKTTIVIDQQSQFNNAQKSLSELFLAMRDTPTTNGPGLPEINFHGMPKDPISFSSSTKSAGLELVDIYLWIFKRLMEKRKLGSEIRPLINLQIRRGFTDEISLNAIAERWGSWFENLPAPEEKDLARGLEILRLDEDRRLQAVHGRSRPSVLPNSK